MKKYIIILSVFALVFVLCGSVTASELINAPKVTQIAKTSEFSSNEIQNTPKGGGSLPTDLSVRLDYVKYVKGSPTYNQNNVYLNDNIHIIVTMTNNGPEEANDQVVFLTIPKQLQYISSTPSKDYISNEIVNAWLAGHFDADETKTFDMFFKVIGNGKAEFEAGEADWDLDPSNDKDKISINVLNIPTVNANNNGGKFNTNQIITLTMNRAGSIYYTTNGSTPTTLSKKYTGPFTISSSTVLKFMGVDLNGYSSIMHTNNYFLDKVAPTVTVSPSGGFYNISKIITLKMNEPGSIYYTTNGQTPTAYSKKYLGPFIITSTTVVKFIGVDLYGNKSAIKSASYFIEKIPPKIISTKPINNSINFSRTAKIYINFSETILKGLNWNNITVKNMTTKKFVSTIKTISGKVLILQNGLRSKNTWYEVRIPASSIKDRYGNNLKTAYTFRFKTSN